MNNNSTKTRAVSRRGFLKTSGFALGVAGLATANSAEAAIFSRALKTKLRKAM
ncbi:MAG: twin-arginine translocation signal domain-containing protein [Verrucomicrobiota bacterium]